MTRAQQAEAAVGRCRVVAEVQASSQAASSNATGRMLSSYSPAPSTSEMLTHSCRWAERSVASQTAWTRAPCLKSGDQGPSGQDPNNSAT